MDRLILTLVSSEASLPDAFAKIRPGTRAIVVSSLHSFVLLTAGDILDAYNEALDSGRAPTSIRIGEVLSSHQPTVFDGFSPQLSVTNLAGVMAAPLSATEQSSFRRAFDEHDRRYLIQQTNQDEAVVVTSSERFSTDMRTSMVICECEGDPIHRFERGQLRNPRICNKPHGKPVKCGIVDPQL